MNDWARRTADKYITKSGADPDSRKKPRSRANAAWREYAESVHRILRGHAATPEGANAIAAFEAIGDAIALDEESARRRA